MHSPPVSGDWLYPLFELESRLLYPLRACSSRPPARGDNADSLASMFSMQIFPCR